MSALPVPDPDDPGRLNKQSRLLDVCRWCLHDLIQTTTPDNRFVLSEMCKRCDTVPPHARTGAGPTTKATT